MSPECERLWLAWRAGELDPAQDERLAELIAGDPAARAAVLADLETEALLATAAVDDEAFVRAVGQGLAAVSDGGRFVGALRLRLRVRRRGAWWWLALPVAAGLALALLLPREAPPPSPSAAPSERIAIGSASFEPDPGSRYRIADDGLLLEHGRVHCSVEPGHGGFVLRTPLARVAVLGTRYSVATDGRVDAVGVSEGRVRITRADGAGIVLDAGLHCAYTADGALVPRLERPATALLVTADPATDRAALALAAILRRDGWTVLLRAPHRAAPPPGTELVVPLQPAPSGMLEDPSRSWHHLPVLNLDPSVNRWLGLSPRRDSDWLDDPGGELELDPVDQAWTAGLAGRVAVQDPTGPLRWAEPLPDVQVLARVTGHGERAAMLLRPRRGEVPPRLFVGIDPASDPTPAGWALLRAAATTLVAEARRNVR